MSYNNTEHRSQYTVSDNLNKKRHILLCGFMAAGKSSIGRTLANYLDLPFFDLDNVIEQKENLPISLIFNKFGEVYFRKKELESLNNLLDMPASVIALGGGALQDQETVNLIRKNSILVYLDVPISLIIKRLYNNKTRPLLYNDDGSKRDKEQLKTYLNELHKKREILYLQSDYCLKIHPNWNQEYTAEKVAKYIRKNLSQS
ncbi:MAG: shikimate kinase [Balneolales bacterium]